MDPSSRDVMPARPSGALDDSTANRDSHSRSQLDRVFASRMQQLGLLVLAVLAAPIHTASASESSASRSPATRFQFEQAHRARPWRDLTADSGSAEPQSADTVTGVIPVADSTSLAPVQAATVHPSVLRACERIRSDDLLRARGPFGSFEGYAGVVNADGLDALRTRTASGSNRSPSRPPERLSWEQVDKLEVRRSSLLRGALIGGATFGALGAMVGLAAVAVSSTTTASVGEGALVGAAIVAPVGIVLGGLSGWAVRRWTPVYVRPSVEKAPSGAPVSAQPQEPTETSAWMSSHLLLSWPTGDFQPPSSERGLGFGFVLAFDLPHRALSPRFEFGTVEHSSSVDSVLVDNPNGIWVDNLQNVQTGSRLTWAMLGVQWDPLPASKLLYLYGMGGLQRIAPTEKLGDGYPVIEADVPGLPSSNGGFAWAAGIGTRLRVPGTKSLALTGEFDYRRLGSADYVAPPGVEGDYPNSRYVVGHGPVETWTARIGLAREFVQRR